MKVKDLVIKKHMGDGYYLIEAPSTNPADNSKLMEVVMHKTWIQNHLGMDEKELQQILSQI